MANDLLSVCCVTAKLGLVWTVFTGIYYLMMNHTIIMKLKGYPLRSSGNTFLCRLIVHFYTDANRRL